MSVDGWNTVLVLGGIRSGKSEFAESLIADAATVRYVATAVGGQDDAEWLARIEAHQLRRPQSWTTEETGADPARLTGLVADAKPDETLLIDDLGGWVASLLDPDRQPADDQATIAELAHAVRTCSGRLVLVSPEVGLSLVPTTALGRAFADALGTTNQALAAAVDGVVLVVAGQPSWLKRSPTATLPPSDARSHPDPHPPWAEAVVADLAVASTTGTTPAQEAVGQGGRARQDTVEQGEVEQGEAAWSSPAMALPPVSSGVVIQPGMDVPLPDPNCGAKAQDRLSTLDLPGSGFGRLAPVIEFAAETQGTGRPHAWRSVAVLALFGRHGGRAAAGSDPADAVRRIADMRSGEGPLARLAAEAGARVEVVETAAAGAMEDGPVLAPESVDAALRQGWELTDRVADAGAEAIVVAAVGPGTDAAAAAVVAATSGAEPVSVLGRVVQPGNRVDDTAWMARCAAVRDAMHRIRHSPRGPRDILGELGGGTISVATGIILGAASRRIPVLVDGPVGVAAGLVSRDFTPQARHWCLLADHGGHPAVKQAADVLGLDPLMDLGLDLGEGVNALAALPLLRAAVGLAAALGAHPALGPQAGPHTESA